MIIPTEEVAGIDALARLLEGQLAAFDRRRDPRAPFLRVYACMTRRLQERLRQGFFADPAWVERVAVDFGSYYFRALDAFDAGEPCPPAWELAHRAALSGRTFVLTDVLLGMNAHVNNDLPQVLAGLLAAGGDWPDSARLTYRRFDHDQINRILHELVPIVEDEVAERYARWLRRAGRRLGRLDDLLATYGLKFYRDEVWKKAGFLLACPAGEPRATALRWIETDALRIAREIERGLCPRWTRPLVRSLRRLRLL